MYSRAEQRAEWGAETEAETGREDGSREAGGLCPGGTGATLKWEGAEAPQLRPRMLDAIGREEQVGDSWGRWTRSTNLSELWTGLAF